MLAKLRADLLEARVQRQQSEEAARASEEQGNLLRFKVEVMVQMLGVEEQRCATLQTRLEASKYLALSQGLSDGKVQGLLGAPSDGAPDVGGAIARMGEEMALRAGEIARSFADAEDRVSAGMPLQAFARHLFCATERVSRQDAAALAARFYDGEMVSVPEFLEFFICSPTVRRARSSGAAVRVGLHLLELDAPAAAPGEEERQRGDRWTSGLQRAVRRLGQVWGKVDASLTLALDELAEEGEGRVGVQAFREALLQVCGADSGLLRRLAREGGGKGGDKQGLTEADAALLAERFSVAGRVDGEAFVRHFRAESRGAHASSPFALGSEWDRLKGTLRSSAIVVYAWLSVCVRSGARARGAGATEATVGRPRERSAGGASPTCAGAPTARPPCEEGDLQGGGEGGEGGGDEGGQRGGQGGD